MHAHTAAVLRQQEGENRVIAAINSNFFVDVLFMLIYVSLCCNTHKIILNFTAQFQILSQVLFPIPNLVYITNITTLFYIFLPFYLTIL
jgi:hypothetical protein